MNDGERNFGLVENRYRQFYTPRQILKKLGLILWVCRAISTLIYYKVNGLCLLLRFGVGLTFDTVCGFLFSVG